MKYLRQPKLMLLTVFSFLTVALFAQEVTVSGTVTNKENNQPLEGVSVRVKNSTAGTTTNSLGQFTIKAPSSESILTFSYVGFGIFERKAGTSGSITIELERKEDRMEEVVVIGYGTKKRVNVQGAVSTIKAAEIEDIPVANLPSALVNRVPGVGVNFSSGKPGSTTTLNLRNSTTAPASFPGGAGGVTSQPLIVIDGIISNPAQWSQSSNADFFENLDASQIEDITFLKDASAAIYGAAGAKGVVLITTKRGKAGKPKISYSGYFGVSTPATNPQTLTAYEHAKFLNDGFILTGAPLNQRFSQADLDSLKGLEDKSWFDYFWKNGKVQRHTMTVSGGTDKITFFAGGSYYNEKGNYGTVATNKYSLRAGMNAKIIDGLTADVTFATDFNREQSNNHSSGSSETDDQTIRPLYLTPKWVPVILGDKLVGFQGANNTSPQNQNWSFLGVHRSGSYRDNRSQGLAVNASLEYKPKFLKGLTARVQFGQNNRNALAKGYFASYQVANLQRRGQNSLFYSDQLVVGANPTVRIANNDQIQEGTTISNSNQFFTTLSYGKKIKDHDFDVMVGFDQSQSEGRNVLLNKVTQIVAGVDEFWAFSNDPTALGSINEVVRPTQAFITAKRSYISRANYSFQNKYFFEFVGRADASVNFLPDTRWGFFPSIGLGWKISDESFFRNIEFINNLKIRATYGLVGEDRIGARLYESRFSQTTGILFGNTATSGLDPSIYPNPLLTWEKARTLNVGFDAAILNNKVTITAEFYQRYTYDGYDTYSASVFPPTAGIPPPVVNYYKQLSWGSEFAVGYRTKFGKDWGFNLDANFGFSNSQLMQSFYNESLLGQFGNDQLGILVGRDPRRYNGSNIGYIAKGILRTQADVDAILSKNPNYLIGGVKPQVGFMDFEDINGDGQITEAGDATLMFDRTTPIIGFGITFGFTYKTFRLSTNMNLSIGGKRFYDSDARLAPTTVRNAPKFWADHWTPENPNGKFPRADAPLATANSTFWAVSGTQSRINNMVLSYQLPKNISGKIGIPDVRVMLTGTNLWNIINPLKYKDPYTSNFGTYPTLRTISLGINASL
ncbi:SusC/RagA family TonB-linked outer membrane protein [Lacibacter sp. H375]|uniref:SusC/RagA family TonB-linked outer membrane protein n=1 Tax=Lacibacter sp. H375 TaxID=3133424 RepID=UPI0030C2D652